MKQINKAITYATEYALWYIESGEGKSYSTSKDQYDDVLAELLICQDGLCAYTEKELRTKSEIEVLKENFKKGISRKFFKRQHINIDHFDSSLKKTDGWKWENLFAVDSVVNREKLTSLVNDILKPDNPSFNSAGLIDYDCTEHIFFANTKLDKQIFERVDKMIAILGLNHSTIVKNRREFITSIILRPDRFSEHEFPTALEICKQRNKY